MSPCPHPRRSRLLCRPYRFSLHCSKSPSKVKFITGHRYGDRSFLPAFHIKHDTLGLENTEPPLLSWAPVLVAYPVGPARRDCSRFSDQAMNFRFPWSFSAKKPSPNSQVPLTPTHLSAPAVTPTLTERLICMSLSASLPLFTISPSEGGSYLSAPTQVSNKEKLKYLLNN